MKLMTGFYIEEKVLQRLDEFIQTWKLTFPKPVQDKIGRSVTVEMILELFLAKEDLIQQGMKER